MKRIFALLLALVMCLSLAACGGGDEDKTPSSSNTPPSSSQQEQQPSNTPDPDTSEPDTPDVSEPSDDTPAQDDAIAVQIIQRGYSSRDECGMITIQFVYPSGEAVKLTEGIMDRKEVDAVEAGFSTESGFTLTTAGISGNTITVRFEATEENYDGMTDITYTKPETAAIACTDGTEIESFSYEVPYANADLL